MNHPMADLVAQLRSIREQGFDFVDLTLEPTTEPESLDAGAVRAALREHALPAVGHTFWALPIASPVERLREAALRTVEECIAFFAEVGVTKVNVHPDDRVPMRGPHWIVERNAAALARLDAFARPRGVTVMAENTPGLFSRPASMRALLEAVPRVGFHLDVGHAHLHADQNTTPDLLDALAPRLLHVHVSDNRGGRDDLHLPLGAGTIDWRHVIGCLKRAGYDGTITLEVFTRDQEYLQISRRKLRQWWDDGAPAR